MITMALKMESDKMNKTARLPVRSVCPAAGIPIRRMDSLILYSLILK